MNAALKGIICTDVDPLESYVPNDPKSFGFSLELLIGPDGQEGMESFQVTVCTPRWLEANHPPEDIILGRHYLIVFEFNYDRLLQRIEKYLRHCTGDTWQEVAEKVARLGWWEFEDYQP